MRILTNKDATAARVYPHSDNDGFIITLEFQDKVKVIDSKSGDYILEPVVVETSRISTQEYIESFKDDVGIENILKKFALCNDPELFNQRKRATVPVDEDGKEFVQDYTIIPTSPEDAIKIAEHAKAVYKALPAELVNNRSFMEFAETCTEAELQAYIAALKKDGE